MVPTDVLGKLPNLQYFASVSGGRIIKGRFPILDPDATTPRRRAGLCRAGHSAPVRYSDPRCGAVSHLCLLVQELYLPPAHPPERFLAQLCTEHQTTAGLWGDALALRILCPALDMQDAARQATPVPSTADTPASSALRGVIAHEMLSVDQRLFDNAYFCSIDALVLRQRSGCRPCWNDCHG